MSVSKMIKEIRSQLGLTQAEMADAIGVSLPSMKRFEANNVKMPGRDIIANIARLIDVQPAEIVRRVWFDNLENDEKGLRYVDPYIQTYLSNEYINGYGVELRKKYMVDEDSVAIYDGVLTKTKETPYKLIVQGAFVMDFGNDDIYHSHERSRKHLLDILNLLFYIYYSDNKIYEYRMLFDYNDSSQRKLFNSFKEHRLDMVKVNFSLLLFDSKNLKEVEYISLSNRERM